MYIGDITQLRDLKLDLNLYLNYTPIGLHYSLNGYISEDISRDF